jgi:nuclear pore complex protein Nup160
MLTTDFSLVEIMHQEIAFSSVGVLQDQARRFHFMAELDKGFRDWITGWIQSIEDIDQAIRTALDIVGGFDMEIKREEDEVNLLLPSSH